MKVFIFDMDGVISDTQNLQANNEEKLLNKYGIQLSADEITEKYAGVSDEEFFPKVFSDFGKQVDLEKVTEEKWEMIFSEAKGTIKEISGSVDFIKILYNNDYRLAVASASIKPFIKLVLNELGKEEYFLVKVRGTEVSNGKPAPDIFLEAARQLQVSPEDCIVIEDGVNGMRAAKNAGMKCIGLVNDKRKDYPADYIVSSFAEIDITNL